MSLKQDHIDAIAVSLLAVNSYGLEKVYALLPIFQEKGLMDPAKVASADISEVMVCFFEAGYHRGGLSEMMAGRLINLMKAVKDGRLDALNDMIKSGRKDEAVELLCQIKGIGPKCAKDAWMLFTTRKG